MGADEIRWLFGYDSWAMGKILDAASGLTEAQFGAASPLGGPGVRELLLHILDAYYGWREGWRIHERVPDISWEQPPSLAAFRQRWSQEEGSTNAFLAQLSDDDMAAPFIALELWQTMLHVVNHGTQHRAEIATLLTHYGQSPGDVDLVFYAEERLQAPGE